MYQCILASGSPRRKEILEQCGISFVIEKSDVEEVVESTVPAEVVKELSIQKARDVAEKTVHDAYILIGADTVVANEGRILGKPKDEADAVQMVQSLQGHEHSVYTGVAILIKREGKLQELSFYEETKVKIAQMTEEEIAEYVASDLPFDKAGSYAIQGGFAPYVAGIQGDYYNVVGLPIARIRKELKQVGINLKNDCKK